MDLRDYPRPKGDTGIGVHWSAGFPAALGSEQIRDHWLPQLAAMGVKWVKLARHDGGTELDELLLKNDILPIVRVCRPQLNPGTLDADALGLIKGHVAAGVRYFEFNNEPDLAAQWQDNRMPPAALAVVAHNAIVDMEAILKLGGYPGIPAVSAGSQWDLVGEICRQGRRDLLHEPVWQAIHNYCANHPLEYPYDPGNQQGAPYTQAFYDKLAAEAWEGEAWGGWSLEQVNQERKDRCNPSATPLTEPTCWRAYERCDALIRSQIGRSLPILATEDGYVVGERTDARYPATTPRMHGAQTLEACRTLMGTSQRFQRAPDYFFCSAFWLLGNYTLGHWAAGLEKAAWYSSRWPEGELVVVAALRAEPKQERVWHGDIGAACSVSGTLTRGAGLTLRLTAASGWLSTATAGADGCYQFVDVPPGSYVLAVVEASVSREIELHADRRTETVDFDLTGLPLQPADSAIRGTVCGGAGRALKLSRLADRWVLDQVIGADSTYCFTGLAAGDYVLAFDCPGVDDRQVTVDGTNVVVVDCALPAWSWEVADFGPSPGFGIVRCRVTGRAGVEVRIWAPGWQGGSKVTGSKPEYGPDVCEFAPLGAGTYFFQPEAVDVKAEVTLDGRRTLAVTFIENNETSACATQEVKTTLP